VLGGGKGIPSRGKKNKPVEAPHMILHYGKNSTQEWSRAIFLNIALAVVF